MGKNFNENFPEYKVMTIESDKVGFMYLGYDHFGDIEEVIKKGELPLGVFYITNFINGNSAADYFIHKTVIEQETVQEEFKPETTPLRKSLLSVRNKYITLPNPKMYFSITNGLDSTGMIYFDNQGRSWRNP